MTGSPMTGSPMTGSPMSSPLMTGSPLRAALALCAAPLEPHNDGWQRLYRLPAASPVFAGHFPQRPVLPAVVQCLMAQMTVEEGLGHPLLLETLTQAKFTAVLAPETDILLAVRPAARDGHWDCTLHAQGVPAARMQLHLRRAARGATQDRFQDRARDSAAGSARDSTCDNMQERRT